MYVLPYSQIAKDATLSLDSPAAREPHPSVVTARLPLLRTFTEEATSATTTILASLSRALGLLPLPPPEVEDDDDDDDDGAVRSRPLLEAYHRAAVPSPSMLRLLRYAPLPAGERGAPQAAHTDLGSLTVLFAGAPGLQRQNPGRGRSCRRRGGEEGEEEEEERVGGGGSRSRGGGAADADADAAGRWEYVAPREGCAVVNVGDGLVALTGGLLHSCLHRVVPLPGRGMGARCSFAWMERAEAPTVMRALEGGIIPQGGWSSNGGAFTSVEWLRRKFVMLRK